MNTDLMFSSNKDDWETPQWLFDDIRMEFDIKVDLAANKNNKKTRVWMDKETTDALDPDRQWNFGSCYCNPPYGREIGKFVKKAYEQQKKHGNVIVMLLPARTDTKWFHDYILDKAEIRFLKGRLRFEVNGEPCKNSAPFPSMIVIYK